MIGLFHPCRFALVAVGAVWLLAPPQAAGQGQSGAPKTWAPPRTLDGQPDMRGVWTIGSLAASHSLEEGCCDLEHMKMQGWDPKKVGVLRSPVIVNPPDGRIPYQPWAAAKRREHLVNLYTPTRLQHLDPQDRCQLLGVPRSSYRGDLQIQQLPGYVVILHEWDHAYRVVPLDGRPHIAADIKLYNGDLRGHWEGDTLVVDTTNLNDKNWLDSHGSFHSDALHVVERWTLVDANTIKYEAVLDDPGVFTRPWTIVFTGARKKERGYEFIEEACHEGVGPTLEHFLAAGRLAVATGQTGIHTHQAEQK